MSVCLSVRMNAEISETIKATKMGFGMQILEVLLQSKYVSAKGHVHFNEMYWFRQY